MNRFALVAGAFLALACSSAVGPIPEPPAGAVGLEGDSVLGFYQRAESFYRRLILRRVNALETFHDPVLRGHFETQDAFFDYYAALSLALDDANFEKSRPDSVEVEEFLFESETRAWVQVRFRGRDDRPLRPTRTSLVRRDLWQRADERWWVVPGRM